MKNPTTLILMISIFSPELEDYVTLNKFYNPGTCESYYIIWEKEKEKEMHSCQSGNEAVWCYFSEYFDISEMWGLQHSQITNRGMRKNAYTPLGQSRGIAAIYSNTTPRPSSYAGALLNNASSFPLMP